MRLREQYKHLLNYGANLITLLVEGACFAYIWYSVYEEQFGFWRRGNWAVVGLYVLVIFFFTKVFGGYNIGYMRMTDIALSHILSILLSGIVGYLELCLICRDYVEPAPMLGVMAVETVFILPWIYIIRKLYTKLYPPRQMLVIYGHYAPDELISKINTRRDKYNICGSVSYEIGHEKLYPMIREYNAVVLCDLPAQARNQIMKFCYQESIRTYVTPKISDIIFRGADDIHLFDTPLLLSRNQGLSIDQRIIKRTCDIMLSLIGIVIASPFMLIIAMAVKLYDGGPVFYKQERLTRDEKPFMIYKFRSMSMDSEKNGARLAAKGDKRVTPVFCISLKAGGTGLNLTAADIVIHYDPWWNVAVQNQATDRAHRIGQKHVVTVYKLVSEGTIEEKIIAIQERKKELAKQVLEGEGMDSVSFTKEEILELLG